MRSLLLALLPTLAPACIFPFSHSFCEAVFDADDCEIVAPWDPFHQDCPLYDVFCAFDVLGLACDDASPPPPSPSPPPSP